MKKIILAVAAIAATLVFALPSFAADEAKTKHSVGTITAIDAIKASLTIKNHDGEKTFTVTGKAVEKLANFKVGDKVKVAYTDVAGTLTATKIAAAKTEEKPAAPAPASTK